MNEYRFFILETEPIPRSAPGESEREFGGLSGVRLLSWRAECSLDFCPFSAVVGKAVVVAFIPGTPTKSIPGFGGRGVAGVGVFDGPGLRCAGWHGLQGPGMAAIESKNLVHVAVAIIASTALGRSAA